MIYMKKQMMGAVVVIAAIMLTAWVKPLKEIIAPEKTVSKNISVAVYKADTYTSSIYNDASARLQVTVVKVRGNERSVVWQKNYDAKLLKQYPSVENAISQNVVINNIAESKEHLEVLYTLTYDSKGSVMQLQNGEVISKGKNSGKLFINI
jgi:hypothetical protein